MLVLKADRLTAVIAEIGTHRIERTAAVTKNLSWVERIDLDLGTAILTVRTEMLEAFEVAALTLPVTDLVFDILQGCRFAKIRNRKDRLKD